MTGMLDPALHSIDYVRQRSAFLYSAILTVTIKVAQPSNYDSAATFMKNLLGVMFADGVSNVEVVQTLAIVSFWGDSTDDSLSKKLAYAIRTAFELGMHKRAKRPLPEHDELLSRQILVSAAGPGNPEPALITASHRIVSVPGCISSSPIIDLARNAPCRA